MRIGVRPILLAKSAVAESTCRGFTSPSAPDYFRSFSVSGFKGMELGRLGAAVASVVPLVL
jgi:hypothetical protein